MAVTHDTIPAVAPTPPSQWAESPLRSALVGRLVRPGIDPAKRRIRARLLLLSDAQLQAGLGLSEADVDALRAAGRDDSPAVDERPGSAHQPQPVERLRRLQPTQSAPARTSAIVAPRVAAAEAMPA
jgi:hypothetical protein